jgi:hypothetical protein
MESFLSGRTQAVIVEGETSTYLPLDSGVPQGSTLGPSLFLYYINDIATGLDSTQVLNHVVDELYKLSFTRTKFAKAMLEGV